MEIGWRRRENANSPSAREHTFLAIMKQIEIPVEKIKKSKIRRRRLGHGTYLVNESNMKQWNVTRFLKPNSTQRGWAVR